MPRLPPSSTTSSQPGADCKSTSDRQSRSCSIEPRPPRRNWFNRRRTLRAEQEIQALDWEVYETATRDLPVVTRSDAQICAAFPSAMFPSTFEPVPEPQLEDPEDDILEAMRGMSVAEILAYIQDSSGAMPPVAPKVPSPLPSPPSPRGATWPPLPPGPPPAHARVHRFPPASAD